MLFFSETIGIDQQPRIPNCLAKPRNCDHRGSLSVSVTKTGLPVYAAVPHEAASSPGTSPFNAAHRFSGALGAARTCNEPDNSSRLMMEQMAPGTISSIWRQRASRMAMVGSPATIFCKISFCRFCNFSAHLYCLRASHSRRTRSA